jgi:hypothetical protein
MWTLAFWRALTERAISTAAETAGATILATGVATAWAVPWAVVGGATLLATLLSALKGIAAAASTDGSPSLSGAEVLTPVPRHAADETLS